MTKIKVETTVAGTLDKAWEYWNEPRHITCWAFASDDWECPKAENDPQVGGKFVTKMAAKDKSTSFEFSGQYTKVVPKSLIEYKIEDGRTVSVTFTPISAEGVKITEEFEPEAINSEEIQKSGWQAILDNFKKYVEAN